MGNVRCGYRRVMSDERSTTPPTRTSPVLRAVVDGLEQNDVLDGAAARLQPAAETIADGPFGEPLRGTWLGHALHPLLTDVPLGCWIGAGLLDLTGARRFRSAARCLVGLGLLAVPVTVASGLVEWSALTDPRVRRVGVAHAAGNGAVATFYLVSWLSRRRGRHAIGLAAAFAGGGLAVVTGYLGGHLSFARGAGVGPRGSG